MNMLLKNITKNWKNVVVGLLAWLLAGAAIYFRGKGIIGPFIFYDEQLYFNAARSIHLNAEYPNICYNPLYSFCISFFIMPDNLVLSYKLIRIFNALSFASMIFPVYFIARTFFEKPASIVLTAGILLSPWGAISSLIWAEPLFYTLYMWSAFAFMLFVRRKETGYGIFLGVTLGLLFLAKQGGLVLIIAVILSLAYEFFMSDKGRRPVRAYGVFFLSLTVVVLPWILRNMFSTGLGALGDSERMGKFASFNPFKINYSIFVKAFMYQFSYLASSVYLVFLVLFAYAYVRFSRIARELRSFFILILLAVMGVLALNTMHRYYNPGEDLEYHLTFGRYMGPVIPFIMIIGLNSLFTCGLKLKTFFLLSAAAVLLGVLTSVFSPLDSLCAYGIINSADTAYLNMFFNTAWDAINWGKNPVYTATTRIVFSSIILAFSIILSALSLAGWKKIVYLMTAVVMAYTGFAAAIYAEKVSMSAREINRVEKYVISSGYGAGQIFFDSQISSQNLKFIHAFWYDSEPQFVPRGLMPSSFDFGTKDSVMRYGSLRVAAPWDASAGYSKSKGWGFTNLFNIDSRNQTQKLIPDGTEDFIFGAKEQEFRIDYGQGDYLLAIHLDLTNSEIKDQTEYDIVMNGQSVMNVAPAREGKSYNTVNIKNAGNSISLVFKPVRKYWAVSRLDIFPLDDTALRPVACYITKNELADVAQQHVVLDFGTKGSPLAKDAIRVSAPWDGMASYSQAQRWGFTDLFDMDSVAIKDNRGIDGTEDYIWGSKEKEFRMDCPNGLYTIKFSVDITGHDVKNTDYELIINGNAHQVKPHSSGLLEKEFKVKNESGALSVVFKPKYAFWAVSKMEITADLKEEFSPFEKEKIIGNTKIYMKK